MTDDELDKLRRQYKARSGSMGAHKPGEVERLRKLIEAEEQRRGVDAQIRLDKAQRS